PDLRRFVCFPRCELPKEGLYVPFLRAVLAISPPVNTLTNAPIGDNSRPDHHRPQRRHCTFAWLCPTWNRRPQTQVTSLAIGFLLSRHPPFSGGNLALSLHASGSFSDGNQKELF